MADEVLSAIAHSLLAIMAVAGEEVACLRFHFFH